jgi:deoxyribonuclease V
VIAIVDVHYSGDKATAACLTASNWTDAKPLRERVVRVDGVAPYVPGKLYLRELPPILAVLDHDADVVVIDAYVWLAHGRKGLGARLADAIDAAVVGVAKTPFRGARAIEVLRGESKKPLYVTSTGLRTAPACIRSMHGDFRIPTLLRRADELSRS